MVYDIFVFHKKTGLEQKEKRKEKRKKIQWNGLAKDDDNEKNIYSCLILEV